MKIKIAIFSVIIMWLCFGQKIFPQEKLILNVGIGFTDLLNVGIRYQFDQVEVGLNGGTWPQRDIFTLISDIRFHFGNLSNLSTLRNWYVLIGFRYLRDEYKTGMDKFLYLEYRIGRNINFSKKLGIELNIGIAGQLMEDKIIKIEQEGPLGGIDISVIPTIGFNIFYRF